jgi:hypothetical protein
MSRTKQAARSYLASVAADLSPGSVRLQCPFCNGGADGEISLVLTVRHDGSWFCCHRAGCGQSGALNGAFLGDEKQHVPEKPRAVFAEATRDVLCSDPAMARWDRACTMGVPPERAGLVTTMDGSQEVWALYDANGLPRAVQVRGAVGPKRVKTYKEYETKPVYGYYWPIADSGTEGRAGVQRGRRRGAVRDVRVARARSGARIRDHA